MKVTIFLFNGEDKGCFSYTNYMPLEEFNFFMDELRNGLDVESYGEIYRYNTDEPYTVGLFRNRENEDQLSYHIHLYKVIPILLSDE